MQLQAKTMSGPKCMPDLPSAKEEGFDKIAFLFEEVGKPRLKKSMKKDIVRFWQTPVIDRVFQREEKKVWICTNCGKIVIAEKARKNVRYATILKAISS